MFIDKDSLIVNGVNFANYVTEVKYGYNKLWAEDSGRNLAGTQSGLLEYSLSWKCHSKNLREKNLKQLHLF